MVSGPSNSWRYLQSCPLWSPRCSWSISVRPCLRVDLIRANVPSPPTFNTPYISCITGSSMSTRAHSVASPGSNWKASSIPYSSPFATTASRSCSRVVDNGGDCKAFHGVRLGRGTFAVPHHHRRDDQLCTTHATGYSTELKTSSQSCSQVITARRGGRWTRLSPDCRQQTVVTPLHASSARTPLTARPTPSKHLQSTDRTLFVPIRTHAWS